MQHCKTCHGACKSFMVSAFRRRKNITLYIWLQFLEPSSLSRGYLYFSYPGFFGEVFRGIWNGTEVAIKVFLEQDLTAENMEDFCNEISILRYFLVDMLIAKFFHLFPHSDLQTHCACVHVFHSSRLRHPNGTSFDLLSFKSCLLIFVYLCLLHILVKKLLLP